MKSFELLMPKTLDEAVKALPTDDTRASRAGTMMLAGGQDLLGELKDHLAEPDTVVNLKSIPGLDRIEHRPDGGLDVGALATVGRIEADPGIRERFAMLAEGCTAVASPQIRNAGTLGGNLCQRPRCMYYRSEHAPCLKKGGDECFSYEGHNKYNAILGGGPSYIVHPSDVAPPLVAFDATVTIRGADGERTIPLEKFYTLPSEGDVTRETVLGPNEIVTGVSLPGGREGWRTTYLKVRERDAFDFALSAVALALKMDGDRIADVRMTLGGVAPVPWRCASTEKLLVGKKVDAETCKAAGEEALRLAEPLEHNGYKIPMTKGLITKALRKLADA